MTPKAWLFLALGLLVAYYVIVWIASVRERGCVTPSPSGAPDSADQQAAVAASAAQGRNASQKTPSRGSAVKSVVHTQSSPYYYRAHSERIARTRDKSYASCGQGLAP